MYRVIVTWERVRRRSIKRGVYAYRLRTRQREKRGTRSVIIKVRAPEYCIVKFIIRQMIIAIVDRIDDTSSARRNKSRRYRALKSIYGKLWLISSLGRDVQRARADFPLTRLELMPHRERTATAHSSRG